ncbi:MAG: YggS family pyridoxal phosphate-dependent enzyme [Planctomycetota bacterium]|nr:YggS family pyridoxal phosphate-dependent enzyme [Planctomycetota bacterium]
MSLTARIAENLAAVRQRIAAACGRAGRDPADVTLVAVTKYAQIEWIEALLSVGEIELGENRPQQLAARAALFPATVHWHLIGPLQRNKANLAVRHAELVHSVDSSRLLPALDTEAASTGRKVRVLLEVNLSGEEQKHGFGKDELEATFDSLHGHPHVSIEGLMTMAAYTDDPEAARPTFRELRLLRDRLQLRCPAGVELRCLSMGMSGDFEPAIEEGATLVRIGSALWEGLEAVTAS